MNELCLTKGVPEKELLYHQTPPVQFPSNLFKLPTLAAFVGARGMGKTYSGTALMKYHFDNDYFTRGFIISPTYESNEVLHLLPIREEDVYKVYHGAQKALTDIIEKAEADFKIHKNMKIYRKLYMKMKKAKEEGKKYEDMDSDDRKYMEEMQTVIAKLYFDVEERVALGKKLTNADKFLIDHIQFPDTVSFRTKPLKRLAVEFLWPLFFPPYKMKHPHAVIFIDDMSHSDIYSTAHNNPLVNLSLRHRHLGGAGYGVTIYFLVQTFKTGVPLALRFNCQQFHIFGGSDLSVLDSMYEEFAGLCDKETFYRLYFHAVGDHMPSHDFLTIDKNATDYSRRFRKNFDIILNPDANNPTVSPEEDNTEKNTENMQKKKSIELHSSFSTRGEDSDQDTQLYKRKRQKRKGY
jgi:hypothetical protein